MTLSVFRTFKADIVTGVRGVVILKSTNPRRPLQCEPIGFESKEFDTLLQSIPRKLRVLSEDGSVGEEVDVFDDLVYNGELEVWIRCDDRVQYFGMAQADLYIDAPPASVQWNFAKAYISMWLQMIIVVCLGVMFSTFLSSPVAILATMSAVMLGFFRDFVRSLWTGEAFGGGPIEALVRLVTQENLTSQLELSGGRITVVLIESADKILLSIMNAFAVMVPDFGGLGERLNTLRIISITMTICWPGSALLR